VRCCTCVSTFVRVLSDTSYALRAQVRYKQSVKPPGGMLGGLRTLFACSLFNALNIYPLVLAAAASVLKGECPTGTAALAVHTAIHKMTAEAASQFTVAPSFTAPLNIPPVQPQSHAAHAAHGHLQQSKDSACASAFPSSTASGSGSGLGSVEKTPSASSQSSSGNSSGLLRSEVGGDLFSRSSGMPAHFVTALPSPTGGTSTAARAPFSGKPVQTKK
jgi:hypothetical protein